MNKKSNIILVIVAILMVVGLIIWMEKYDTPVHDKERTTSPFIADIEKRILISGNVYPGIEVDVKSSISGILEKLYVDIGKDIHAEDDIAKIKLIPSPTQIENATSNLKMAFIEYENAEKEYNRDLQLFESKIITPSDFERAQKQYDLAKQHYQSTQNQMTILVAGYSNTADISNVIKAPISGTVIELPLEEGASVIERNNFNVGTTLAVIAQMNYFLFKGKVNEMDLIKLHTGMPITLSLNAMMNKKIQATIEKIYPKGIMEQGIMKYFIAAKFSIQNDSINVRSGYTATAELILESRENVLCIDEKHIIFNNDSTFVDLIDGKTSIRKYIKTGISDGIKIEILDGLTVADKVKMLE
ncbi:MAG: efflux RND transporter periplasmic adaptor subunit [Bacteroidales bacterium]|jgi:HlyD family secretion protein|nr:efflux RND transporter periplasmic adaptor subunit [Bacteroidales bacterium]